MAKIAGRCFHIAACFYKFTSSISAVCVPFSRHWEVVGGCGRYVGVWGDYILPVSATITAWTCNN